MYGDLIDILRAEPIEDRYGNAIPGDWEPSSTDVPAAVQPATSDENLVDRDTIVTRYRLYLGPDTDLLPTDRVAWHGLEFDVDGDLERHSRKGTPHHIEAFLRRTTG